MEITDLFSPELTCYCTVGVPSKKKALEKISKLISAHTEEIQYQPILDALQHREKMGATVLDYQIALPHARVKEILAPCCAVLNLEKAIAFSSTENKPVTLIFGLVVPQEYVEEHLQLLAQLAEKLRQESVRNALQACRDNATLYQTLVKVFSSE